MLLVKDLIGHCLQIDIDSQIYINDNKDGEVFSGKILDIPTCLFDEEIRYFSIKMYRGIDKDEYVLEITLENPMKIILDNVYTWMSSRK